jgi:hypothetical protein
MAFDSKPEYLDLIKALADTPVTRAVETDYVTFGSTKVRFLGSDATVTYLGPVRTSLRVFRQPSALRRVLRAFGLASYDDPETTIALRHSGVFTTPQGQPATEVHSQELTLAFAAGHEGTFDVHGVGSSGLHHLRPGVRVTAVFATTGSDLVPFAIKCGLQWHLLWNGILERLAAAKVWGLGELEVRLQGHSGYIVDTLRHWHAA